MTLTQTMDAAEATYFAALREIQDQERESADSLRCGVCGVAWDEHSVECSRHAYRPERRNET